MKTGKVVGISAVIIVGLLATGYIVVGNKVKKQGFARTNFQAKIFSVPYLEKGYTTISEQIGDEARENKLTKDGLEFR